MEDNGILSPEEIRSALRRYKGKKHDTHPKESPKSTKIAIWDIAIIAGIRPDDMKTVWRFLKGTHRFGPKCLKRFSDAIRLIDAGLVTKTQFGCYHFHDTPPVKPAMKMQITITMDGVRLTGSPVQIKEKEFPDFRKVFGGK